MKCSYCGGDSSSFEKCTCCGSPVSDDDIEAEIDRIWDATRSGDEIPSGDYSEAFLALNKLHERKNFKKSELLGACFEALAVNQHKKWQAHPGNESAEEASAALRKGIAMAFQVFEAGAEGGNVLCMLKTADYYHKGFGCDADQSKYKYWLKKAADEGCDEAKELLRDIESSANEVVSPEVSSGKIWTIIGLIIAAACVGFKIFLAFLR